MQSGIDSSSSPVFSEVGLISLGGHCWTRPWRSDHYLLPRLTRYFQIIWCDPAQSWRSFGRIDLTRWEDGVYDEPAPPGLKVYRPEKWLPAVGRPDFLARWTRGERFRRAQNYLLEKGCHKTILLLNRPQYAYSLDLIKPSLSCYRICDEYTFSETERPLGETEARLISQVDQVFITSPGLFEKKGHLNPETVLTPNGVDYASYSASYVEPEDIKAIAHPRVGYVGIIKDQLDFPLLITLARLHKEWSFVLIGPKGSLHRSAALFQRLLDLPNVYWLGGKPLGALPAYTQQLDVCLLIYKVNGYTKFVYPLKLHAYLASGRPVVGSPIRTLHDFSQYIRLAQTPVDWSKAITDMFSLDAVSGEQVEARRRIACQHDWSVVAETIARRICEKLGPSYFKRFEKMATGTASGHRHLRLV